MAPQPEPHTSAADIPNKEQQETPQSRKENMVEARAPGHLARVEGKSTSDTAAGPNPEAARSHTKDGERASVVPLRIQEELREGVERTVSNAIHDTGSK